MLNSENEIQDSENEVVPLTSTRARMSPVLEGSFQFETKRLRLTEDPEPSSQISRNMKTYSKNQFHFSATRNNSQDFQVEPQEEETHDNPSSGGLRSASGRKPAIGIKPRTSTDATETGTGKTTLTETGKGKGKGKGKEKEKEKENTKEIRQDFSE